MAQSGIVYLLSTVDGVHFNGALAQNAALFEAIALPQSVGVDGTGRCRIREMTIWSSQNLAWEVWVWSHKDPTSPDPNSDYFRGRWTFVVADGIQPGAAGLYYYNIPGLDILFENEMPPSLGGPNGKIYLTLVNRSATAKTQYSLGGHFRLRLGLEPSMGW